MTEDRKSVDEILKIGQKRQSMSLPYMQEQSRATLIKIAEREGVILKPSWNRNQIAFEIRRQQQAKEKAAQPATPAATPGPELQDQIGQRPENQAFEQALIEPPPDGRGGPRPGAGRPEGLSNEACKVRSLPKQPNETVVAAFKTLFSLWSRKTNLPEIELTDTEARELALPFTQLLEYYYPGGIPEIAWVWASAIFVTYTIFNKRIILIEAARKAKKDGQGVDNANSGQVGIGQNPQGDTASK